MMVQSCRRSVLIVVFCSLVWALMGATYDNVLMDIADGYGRIRSLAGEREMAKDDILLLLERDPCQVYDALSCYLSHTNEHIRFYAVSCVADLVLRGRGKGNPVLEKRFAKALLSKFIKDEDRGSRHSFLRMLGEVPRSTFDEELTMDIQKIHKVRGLQSDAIGLYEIADMRSNLPILKSNLVAIAWPAEHKRPDLCWESSDKWSLCRLLAKWGDRESITNYLKTCEAMIATNAPVPDKLMCIVKLREIRDPLAVQILTNALFSSEQGLGIGGLRHVAAASLSEMVNGFPVGRFKGYYNDLEVEVCRNWAKQQTDFVLKP